MGIIWAWSFEDESVTQLEDWGFDADSLGGAGSAFSATAVAEDLWTFEGAPAARRALQIHANNHTLKLPTAAGTPSLGAITIPYRHDGTQQVAGGPLLRVETTPNAFRVEVRFQGPTSLSLWVGSVMIGTTSAIDFSQYREIGMSWDTTSDPHVGELWVDGVSEVSGSYPRAAQTTDHIMIGGGMTAAVDGAKIGQIILWSLEADGSTTGKYATTFEATTDGTNVGPADWTPTEASDTMSVGGTLDTAKYTENPTPVSLDKVNVTGGTIASQLGITPGVVDSVTVHALFTGQAISAHAEIGDGSGVSNGGNITVDVSIPSYAHKTATTKPSGGAWAVDGTDSPELNAEIA